MRANRTVSLIAAFVGFAMSVSAQIDGAKFAADIRAKYGTPLARETFIIPAGEMVVDYATNGNVCRIVLPAVAPDSRQPGVKTTQAADDFVLELVPLAVRGKELGRMVSAFGAISVSTINYDNVAIAKGYLDERQTDITVTFTKEKCQDQPVL
jgi:hypothetical protein